MSWGDSREEIWREFGSLFGVQTYMVEPWRRYVLTWGPSYCEDCLAPDLQMHWVNYNYRVCPACWYIGSSQVWRFLEFEVGEQAAALIWEFLLEPGQYPE
jgi:hypothetical protein